MKTRPCLIPNFSLFIRKNIEDLLYSLLTLSSIGNPHFSRGQKKGAGELARLRELSQYSSLTRILRPPFVYSTKNSAVIPYKILRQV